MTKGGEGNDGTHNHRVCGCSDPLGDRGMSVSKYDELVKSLRHVAENQSTTTPELLTDAADAIEELQTANEYLTKGIQDATKKIRRISKLMDGDEE